jgi:hypothetical protein
MSLQGIIELTLKHAVSTRVVENLQTKSYLNGICGTITGHNYIILMGVLSKFVVRMVPLKSRSMA